MQYIPTLESLESRELLSYSPATLPHTIPAPVGNYNMVNGWNSSGLIVNNDAQEWVFNTEHTATYVISVVGTHGMVPIWAIYNSKGQELGYYENGKSSAIAKTTLDQGQKYELLISNLTGYPAGNYTVSVEGPTYSKSVFHGDGRGLYAHGSFTLSGDTLTMTLSVTNDSSPLLPDHHTDTLTLRFFNTQGQQIQVVTEQCTTNWDYSFPSHTWSWNISSWNLTGFSSYTLSLN